MKGMGCGCLDSWLDDRDCGEGERRRGLWERLNPRVRGKRAWKGWWVGISAGLAGSGWWRMGYGVWSEVRMSVWEG